MPSFWRTILNCWKTGHAQKRLRALEREKCSRRKRRRLAHRQRMTGKYRG